MALNIHVSQIPKESVQISSAHTCFDNIISGVPQSLIIGSILFNSSINNLFHIIEKASMFNFGDDNTLSAYSKTTEDLHILLLESLKIIKWFKENDS